MARPLIPDVLARRHLIEGELDPARALRIAEAYVAEGRPLEAVAFFEKAGARERLEALAEEAVAAGDVFLLRTVAAAQGDEPSPERWRALAEAAKAAGKLAYAREAELQSEREAED